MNGDLIREWVIRALGVASQWLTEWESGKQPAPPGYIWAKLVLEDEHETALFLEWCQSPDGPAAPEPPKTWVPRFYRYCLEHWRLSHGREFYERQLARLTSGAISTHNPAP